MRDAFTVAPGAAPIEEVFFKYLSSLDKFPRSSVSYVIKNYNAKDRVRSIEDSVIEKLMDLGRSKHSTMPDSKLKTWVTSPLIYARLNIVRGKEFDTRLGCELYLEKVGLDILMNREFTNRVKTSEALEFIEHLRGYKGS